MRTYLALLTFAIIISFSSSSSFAQHGDHPGWDISYDRQERAREARRIESRKVYVHNKTSETLWILVRYKQLGGGWVTDGWYKIPSDARIKTFSTENKLFYYYAYQSNGSRWAGSDNYQSFGGSTYGMRKKSYDSGPFTLNLTE